MFKKICRFLLSDTVDLGMKDEMVDRAKYSIVWNQGKKHKASNKGET
jgi:hypothetical protein